MKWPLPSKLQARKSLGSKGLLTLACTGMLQNPGSLRSLTLQIRYQAADSRKLSLLTTPDAARRSTVAQQTRLPMAAEPSAHTFALLAN